MLLLRLACFCEIRCVAWVCTTITDRCKHQQTEGHDGDSKQVAFFHERKEGRCDPLSITSELDGFKRGHSENLCNLGTLNVLIASCETIKNLEHFGAVTSSAKHSDHGLFGHGKKEKVEGEKCKELRLNLQDNIHIRRIQCHQESGEVRYHW